MEKKRIDHLDIAKGIGVILMVLGHVPDLNEGPRMFITSFHMPLFFILSGMILSATSETEKDMGTIVRRKARSIMRPYLIFSVLDLILEFVCARWLGTVDWAVFKEHLFAAVCLSGISVFWFLPALFFGELLWIGIRKKTSGAVCAAAVVALAAAGYLALMGENRLYAAFSETGWMPYLHLFLNALIRVPFAAAFVAAGYAACPLLKKMSVRTWQNLAAGILCMAVTFAVSRLNGITDMNYMVYNNILLYLVTSLCGSFGIIFLSRWLERWCGTAPLKALIYYGKNSLVVMMTHAPFYIMYLAARFTYGVNNHIVPLGQFPLCAMMVCIVLVIEIPVCELINRYFPFLIGKSKI